MCAANQLRICRTQLIPFTNRQGPALSLRIAPAVRSFMSEAQQQDGKRVAFERPIEARLMAIDGTWQRPCKIHDVSETSAKLVIDGSITDIGQKEFFLVLSATGLAYRHCELSWVNGEFVGVQFMNRGRAAKR